MVTIIHGHSILELIQYIKTKCCLWVLLSAPDLGISALRASFLTVIGISVIRSNKLSCQLSWFRCLLRHKVSCAILICYLTLPSSMLSNHSLMIPKCNRLTGCCVLFVSFQNCFNTILRLVQFIQTLKSFFFPQLKTFQFYTTADKASHCNSLTCSCS